MKRYSLVLIALAFLTNMLSLDAEAMRRTVRLRNRGITSLRDPRLTRRLREGVTRVDLANFATFSRGELIVRNPNTISNFDGIEDFPSTVEEIILAGNDINSFLGLDNAPQGLKILDLTGNEVVDMSTFPNLPNLENLDLSSSLVADFSNAGFLQIIGLKALDLSFNDISDVSFLTPLINLESLNLSDNNISDGDFSALEGLKFLSLANNLIGDNGVSNLPASLEVLFLSGNNISDLSNFNNIPATIRRLSLGGNSITNEGLLNFAPPSNLCQLFLTGNPTFNASNLNLSQLENFKFLGLQRTSLVDLNIDLPQSTRLVLMGQNQTDTFRRGMRRRYRESNPDVRLRFRRGSGSLRAIRRRINMCGG